LYYSGKHGRYFDLEFTDTELHLDARQQVGLDIMREAALQTLKENRCVTITMDLLERTSVSMELYGLHPQPMEF